ncbi:MAG TPA: tetratricopeptide repeat protein [Pararobbsia sp.]|jgi:predicted negative regulator of RcsB-dependent stress response|nr:tetratricopeptide repeat protein [Pararobbsia sp.]
MSYHEEQETLDELKAWWARWGNGITWVVLIALLIAAGFNGWNYWQRKQTAKASELYETLQQAVTGQDKAHIAVIAQRMEDDYGRTPYAQMTALQAARALYLASDVDGAKAQLQWAIDHAKDAEYREIAKLRLAGVLLDQKDFAGGLKLLADEPPAAFKGLFADRRGDLLAAQGKNDDARVAYKSALAATGDMDASQKQLIQFKLDALGG